MAEQANAPLDSLLDQTEANDAQLWLTLGEVGFSPVRVDRQGPKKRYTGALLFHENPALYKAIVVLACEPGISIRRVCEIVHCTDDTVKGVIAREPRAVAARKNELLNEGQIVRRASLERLNELVPTMSAKDAALTFGIVTDKVELLSGGVTQRVEVTDGAAVLKRFMDLHERIEKTVRGEVIESKALVIGSAGQNPATNSAAAPEPGPERPEPITADNNRHVKSNCVDAETVTDDAITPIEVREPATDVPATADEARAPGPETGAGGVRDAREACMPHPLEQPEIL